MGLPVIPVIYILFLNLGFPLVALAFSFWVPESPTYLISKKREERAKKSMKKLYGKKFDTQYKIDNIRYFLVKIGIYHFKPYRSIDPNINYFCITFPIKKCIKFVPFLHQKVQIGH